MMLNTGAMEKVIALSENSDVSRLGFLCFAFLFSAAPALDRTQLISLW